METNTPTSALPRVLPPVNTDTAFFWEGTGQGELRAQRCDGCTALRHPPRPACPTCQSLDWSIQPLSGHGTIHSFVVHRYPPLPGFEMPVVSVLVDLDEGVRMVADLATAAPEDVRIGDPVAVTFVTEGAMTLPRFTLVGSQP